MTFFALFRRDSLDFIQEFWTFTSKFLRLLLGEINKAWEICVSRVEGSGGGGGGRCANKIIFKFAELLCNPITIYTAYIYCENKLKWERVENVPREWEQ